MRILILSLVATWNLIAQLKVNLATVNPNYRIYPSTVTQTECFIINHPFDQNILFGTANTITFVPGFFVSEGVYTSTNLGNTWFGSDTCFGGNIKLHGGDPSITIDKYGTFILSRKGIAPFYGLYTHYSNNLGLSWSDPVILTQDIPERAYLASDIFSISSFFGRTYAVWVKYSPPFPMNIAFSDSSGRNWSQPIQINNPSNRCVGGDVVVAKNGNIYVSWATVQSSSPYTEKFVGFASSSNGGINWIVKENAFVMNGIQGTLQQKQNIRVDGIPRIAIDNSSGIRSGWIYIITTEKNLSPAGSDPDIIFHRSTDGGVTWSAGFRVNQDVINNGKVQYFPAINVDEQGGINILYYDDRNTQSDSAAVFLSRSTDGGNTWRDHQVSDHNFKPTPIGGLGQGYQGDNIGITSRNKTLFPVWMDNSSGIYQVWSTKIDIPTLDGIESEGIILAEYLLHQNYPNPFNPETKISFNISKQCNVSLTVYNSLGQVIEVMINKEMIAGYYEIDFLARNLPSGIYFYKLQAGRFSSIKKMVLMK
jgi:hypothetical protein